METLKVFDLPIRNVSMESALDLIDQRLMGDAFTPVYFINAHCVNVAFRCQEYAESLRGNELNFADGVGVRIAVQSQGGRLCDNVNGTDMFPRLCSRLSSTPTRVFLLGGEAGVALQLAERMNHQYGQINIVGTHQGHFAEADGGIVAEKIRASKADLVLVAMGVPRQELWIERHGRETGAKVLLAVGGLFNFYSGRIPRAPRWMRRSGLEWLHRLIQEPRRMWRRYLIGNGLFLFRVAAAMVVGAKPIGDRKSPQPGALDHGLFRAARSFLLSVSSTIYAAQNWLSATNLDDGEVMSHRSSAGVPSRNHSVPRMPRP